LRQRWRRFRRPAWLGTLRRTRPLSYHWGRERGTPVDRYYIDQYLSANRADIRGRVLEMMDTRYTTEFGSNVVSSDVLDIDEANAGATIHADLTGPNALPERAFDCFVLTQTLQFVYELEQAIAGAHRSLGAGGVLLATMPAVSKIDRHAGFDGDYWRFTTASATKAFSSSFGSENVSATAFGNVLAAVAFLMGMAVEELKPRELDFADDFFPVVIGVRAVRVD